MMVVIVRTKRTLYSSFNYSKCVWVKLFGTFDSCDAWKRCCRVWEIRTCAWCHNKCSGNRNIPFHESACAGQEVRVSFGWCCALLKACTVVRLWITDRLLHILLSYRTGRWLVRWLMLNISNILSQQSAAPLVWISHFPGNWLYCQGYTRSQWIFPANWLTEPGHHWSPTVHLTHRQTRRPGCYCLHSGMGHWDIGK